MSSLPKKRKPLAIEQTAPKAAPAPKAKAAPAPKKEPVKTTTTKSKSVAPKSDYDKWLSSMAEQRATGKKPSSGGGKSIGNRLGGLIPKPIRNVVKGGSKELGDQTGNLAKGLAVVADVTSRPLKAGLNTAIQTVAGSSAGKAASGKNVLSIGENSNKKVKGGLDLGPIRIGGSYKGDEAKKHAWAVNDLSAGDILKKGTGFANISKQATGLDSKNAKGLGKVAIYGLNAVGEIGTDLLSHGRSGVGESAGKVAERRAVAKTALKTAKEGGEKAVIRDAKAAVKVASKPATGIGKKEIARKLIEAGDEAAASRVLRKGWQAATDAELKKVGLQAGLHLGGVGVVGGKAAAKGARVLRSVSPGKLGSAAQGKFAESEFRTGKTIRDAFDKAPGTTNIAVRRNPAKALQYSDAVQLPSKEGKAAASNLMRSEEAARLMGRPLRKASKVGDALVDVIEGVDDPNALATIRKRAPGAATKYSDLIDKQFEAVNATQGGTLPKTPGYVPRPLTKEARKAIAKDPGGELAAFVKKSAETADAAKKRLRPGDEFLGVKLVADTANGTVSTRQINEISQRVKGFKLFDTNPAAGVGKLAGNLEQATRLNQRSKRLLKLNGEAAINERVIVPEKLAEKEAAKAGVESAAATVQRDQLLADAAARNLPNAELLPRPDWMSKGTKSAEDKLAKELNEILSPAGQVKTRGRAATSAAKEQALLAEGLKTSAEKLGRNVPDVAAAERNAAGLTTIAERALDAGERRQMNKLWMKDLQGGDLTETEAAKLQELMARPQTAEQAASRAAQAAPLSLPERQLFEDLSAKVEGGTPLRPAEQRRYDDFLARTAPPEAPVAAATPDPVQQRLANLQTRAEQAQAKAAKVKAKADSQQAIIAERLSKAAELEASAQRLAAIGDEQTARAHRMISQAEEAKAALQDSKAVYKSAEELYGSIDPTDWRKAIDGGLWVARGDKIDGQDLLVSRDMASSLAKLEELASKNPTSVMRAVDSVMGSIRAQMLLSPGFHIRNYMGGVFNNWLAGIPMTPGGSRALFRRNMNRFEKGGLEAIPDASIRDIFRQGLDLGAFGLKGQNAEMDLIGKGGSRLSGLNPYSQHSYANQLNRRAGDYVETQLRGELFLDSMLKGMSADEAFQRVVRFHYDADFASRFDKTVGRRALTFYTFTKNNLPLQIEMLATDPGKYTAFTHIQQGFNDENNPDPIPPYYNGDWAVRAPMSIENYATYLKPDLMFRDASALGDPLGFIQKGVSPALQQAWEMKFDSRADTGMPFDYQRRNPPVAKGMAGAIASALGLRNEANQVDPRALAAIRRWMPLTSYDKLVNSGAADPEQVRADRAEGISSKILGMGLEINTPKTQEATLKTLARKGKETKKTSNQSYQEWLKEMAAARGK